MWKLGAHPTKTRIGIGIGNLTGPSKLGIQPGSSNWDFEVGFKAIILNRKLELEFGTGTPLGAHPTKARIGLGIVNFAGPLNWEFEL